RRDTDGRLALAFEEALAAGGAMPDLTQLIAALDGVLTSAHLATLRSVEVDAVTLRYEDYRANRAWTADGGRLSLARDLGSGALSLRGDFAVLTGGSGVATVAMTAASVVGQNDVTLSIAVADVPSEQIATQSAALAWLGAVRAPISGSFRAHLRPNGHLGPLNGTLQAGQGVVQPDPGARPIPFDAARSYVTYDPDTGGLRFDELSVQADWGRVRIVGQASLEGYGTELAPLGTEPDALPLNIMPSNALPDTLSGQFRVSELSLNPNALFDAPLTLTRGAEVDLHLALNPFTLRLGRIWVDDDRLPLHASGVVRADPSGWTVSLDGRVDQIDAQDVLSFWPPEFQAKPRRWVAERVTQATLHDAQFALRVVPGAPPRRFADFGLSDGVIRFHDDFPPIHVAQGRVSFDDARMTAVVDRGHIIEPGWGVLRMDGSRMAIADTTQKPAQGRFDLQGQGDMGPWLALLDRGRIRAMSRMGKTPDLATGRARVQGWLAMPLRRGVRGPDMRWDFQARLSDVATDRLIPNRRLSASQLDLRVTKADIVLRGTAQLDGVPMTGSWTQPLAQQPGQPVPPGVVRANVPISAQTLSTLKITLPKNMVQGQTQGALRVDLGPRGTPPRFALTSDLVGLSARIAPLGWQLGRRQRGELSVSGVLARPVRVDNITLRAAGLNAVGQVALRPDGSFAQLRLDPFALSSAQGRWLNGQVTIEGRGAGRPVAIAVSQGTVDMRRAPKGLAAAAAGGGSGAGAGPQMGPLSLGLRRLRL
ncbi:MAG: hypothetical protein ACPGVS_07310, partial [Primorskyibacter sp.]